MRRWLEEQVSGFVHRDIDIRDRAAVIATVEEIRPEAVILDLQMPKMTGIEFLFALRRAELRKLPVVLVMTGRLTDENVEGYANLGVFDTLYKPFDVQTALGKIRAAMQLRS